jgi:hypothetical protein
MQIDVGDQQLQQYYTKNVREWNAEEGKNEN